METTNRNRTKEAIHHRLGELRAELDVGQGKMAVLDRTRDELRDTLLRIAGAIQVLKELLDGEGQDRVDPSGTTAAQVHFAAREFPCEAGVRAESQG